MNGCSCFCLICICSLQLCLLPNKCKNTKYKNNFFFMYEFLRQNLGQTQESAKIGKNIIHVLFIRVVNQGWQKIVIFSNFATQQCYCAAIAPIWQHFELNSVSQNNSDMFQFRYAIAVIDQHCFSFIQIDLEIFNSSTKMTFGRV